MAITSGTCTSSMFELTPREESTVAIFTDDYRVSVDPTYLGLCASCGLFILREYFHAYRVLLA